MDKYRGLLDTEAGSAMYNIGRRSSTKASGEKPPEVHGTDKLLDPNLEPEHQSKSKLPSIVGSGSPSKSPKKSLTPKRSPRKSVTISEQPPEEIPMPSFDPDPVQVHAGARPKTHTLTGVPIPPPRPLPPMSPMTDMTPSKVLSSIPDGNEGDDVDRIETLRRKYRKVLNPTPIEKIDVGDNEEVLAPQIRIPDQSDFPYPICMPKYSDIRKKPLHFNCTIDLTRKEAKTFGSYQYRVHEYCAKVLPYIRYMQNQEKSLVHGLRQLLIHDLYAVLPELNPDSKMQNDNQLNHNRFIIRR